MERTAVEKRSLLLLWVVFALFAAAQVVWLHVDRRMVVEERHYFAAARLAHALRGTEVGREYPDHGMVSPYPPFVVYYSGALMALLGLRADVAVLTLLPFAALLLWAVWRIARLFMSPTAAATAAVLVLAFHHFAVVEVSYPPYSFLKEYLLDLPMSAFVALTLLLLLRVLRSGGTRARIGLGVIMGLGALTKISYPVYLGVLAVALVAEGYRDRRAWRRVLMPLGVAALIALPWYLRHTPELVAAVLQLELDPGRARLLGKPPIWSATGFRYYLVLLNKMITLPVTVWIGTATALLAVRRRPGWKLLLAGMLCAYLGLSLLYGKDARVIAPCLLFAALAAAAPLDLVRNRAVQAAALACLLAIAGSRMLAMHGLVPGFRDHSGAPPGALAPHAGDWSVERIMADIERNRDRSLLPRLAVVPYLGHFRHDAFMQAALESGWRMVHESSWRLQTQAWRQELEQSAFVVTKSGYNGPRRLTPFRREITEWIRTRLGDSARLVDTYPLPDRSVAALYQHTRTFPTWRRLEPGDESVRPLATFGEAVVLAGCRISRDDRQVSVTCEWRALRAPRREHKLFIQLRRGRKNLAAESYVPGTGHLPVTDWPEGFGLAETYVIALPPEEHHASPDVWLGWHRRGRRMPVDESEFPVYLNAVHVGRAAAGTQPGDARVPAAPAS